MAISLRIVGIFYSTKIELAGGSGTVKAVLDAAQDQITAGTSFSYSAVRIGNYESPNMFRCFKETGFQTVANSYNSGEYALTEDTSTRPAYTVWQYYIRDADGKAVNSSGKFVPYDDPELAVVHDGQSVIWRLVTIVAPTGNSANPRYQKAIAQIESGRQEA